jgi:hypothetical protein
MNRYFPLFAIIFVTLLSACSKKDAGTQVPVPAATPATGNAHARLSGPGYSQSISIEMANNMIQSYLTSVKYPYADTALRALSFDADTLRKYLANPNIVTLKFVVAHQPSYVQSSFGKYAGMDPSALTMIIVGLDENNNVIRNSANGVYEHFDPCPKSCPTASGSSSDALLP